ncbi:MAG: efflux RND transporter periplasmic adaptor subunit [Gammaproteobacteria bacterium]|nr:efflux RND transporter periplasmic adaptor subunit [Gammaproteobacteria bacterium]
MRSLICIVCLTLVVSACNRVEPKLQDIPAVKTAKVVSADEGMALVFASEIQPRYQSDMAFRVGGKLLSREVNLGSRVKQGDILAHLDPVDLNLSAKASQAEVASLEADYVYAKAELERFKQLLDRKYVSAAAYEIKKNAYAAALAKLKAAKAQAAVSLNQANYTNLIADFDGVITAVNVDPGQIVSAGQPIMKLARTDALDAVVNVAESQIEDVRNTKYIDISLWAQPDKVYRGHIREIAGAADIASRTYEVKIQIDNPDNELKLGMTASVAMHGRNELENSATLIPLTALLESGQHAAVYIIGADNHLSLRDVTVAQYREHDAIISAGLKPGERLVALGVHKLRAGEQVNPIPDGSLFASDAEPTPDDKQ